MTDTKVGVIGCGYVGACVAATLADRGFSVLAIDSDAELIAEMERGECRFKEPGLAELLCRGLSSGRMVTATEMTAVGTCDVVVLSVGTPVTADGMLCSDQLSSAAEQLSRHLRAGQLVVLKSTVPPGTSRNVVLPVLESGGLTAGVDFHLAHTPERLAEGTALKELSTLPIVAGGLTDRCLEKASEFWATALGVDVVPQSSLETAEAVKLASNWWIDLNVALANDLAKFCDLYGIDALEVIAAANGIPKGTGSVNILLPGVGVGGSCLTKDPLMVWHSAMSKGVALETARVGRSVNDAMPEYTARLVVEELARIGKDPALAKVAVLGISFKNNTSDIRSTPVLPVYRHLRDVAGDVVLCDPLVDPHAAESMFGVRPCDSPHEALKGADCVAILAYHDLFRGLSFEELPVADDCVILDGRAYLSRDHIEKLEAHGFVYRGIGRHARPCGGAPAPGSGEGR